jgi:hypothetical protein
MEGPCAVAQGKDTNKDFGIEVRYNINTAGKAKARQPHIMLVVLVPVQGELTKFAIYNNNIFVINSQQNTVPRDLAGH